MSLLLECKYSKIGQGGKMLRTNVVYILFFTVLILLINPISPKASENELGTKDEVMQFLKQAFNRQVSLSEKVRSMEEIEELLNPFFSQEYLQKFLDANLYEEDGKYCTYGTDFGQYFIPYLRFSEQTKVVIESNQIYVFEHFEKNHEGPVGYDEHDEGILLEKINGDWKITTYLYNQIPQKITDQAQLEKMDNDDQQKISYQKTHQYVGRNFNAFHATLPNRSIFSENKQNPIYSFIYKRKINDRFTLLL